MCTVTFLPAANGACYITSNRDEKQWRKQALPPQLYNYNGAALTFPKDADAGGTWITMKNNGDAAVLLNGAFKSHVPAPPYRKSRGLIFMDVVSQDLPYEAFAEINLHNIEPFTLVLYKAGNLYECRWDGHTKHHTQLSSLHPHIWSSATLYDEEVVKRRQQWFKKWLADNPKPTQRDIIHFHRFGGEGDTNNDLKMNRGGQVFTVSITSIALHNGLSIMQYLDLQNNQHYTKQTTVSNSLAMV
jgi:uncharacterized protein with NRDE domain